MPEIDPNASLRYTLVSQPDKTTPSPGPEKATALFCAPCVYLPLDVWPFPADLHVVLYKFCVDFTFIGFWPPGSVASGLYKRRPKLQNGTKPLFLSCTTDTLEPNL